MLPIIDRYILREVIATFLAVLSVLMLVVLAQGYLKILKQAAAGTVGSGALLQLLGTEAVNIFGVVIAPAFFFSVLIAIGRMYRENEMTALASGGIGLTRIYRAVLIAAIPIALIVAWLMITLRPWAYHSRADILSVQKETAGIEAAVAGRFTEFRRGNLIFYIEEMDEKSGRLENIFVQNREHGKLRLVTAGKGYLHTDSESGERFVVLEEGRRYEGVPGDNRFSVGSFGRYRVKIGGETRSAKRLPVKALPMDELSGSDDPGRRAEFQFRLLAPISVLVFSIIAVPLSYAPPRSGVYGRLMLAILFYFIFLNTQALSAKWMVSGVTPLWLGTWWVPPFMLLLLGLTLWVRRWDWKGFRRVTGSKVPE